MKLLLLWWGREVCLHNFVLLALDVVAGKELCKTDSFTVSVDGYKWFGKPRNNQKSLKGEGGVDFLVRECLLDEVEFISKGRYEESVCMKVCGGRGSEALYICCMHTDSSSVNVIDSVYEQLKEDVHSFKQKGRVMLLMLGLVSQFM